MYITSKRWISADQLQTNSDVMRAKSKLLDTLKMWIADTNLNQHLLGLLGKHILLIQPTKS